MRRKDLKAHYERQADRVKSGLRDGHTPPCPLTPWTTVSVVIEQAGDKREPFGRIPEGFRPPRDSGYSNTRLSGVTRIMGTLRIVGRRKIIDPLYLGGGVQMFGVFRIATARKACVTALSPVVLRPQVLGPWPPHFWQDPYVLGWCVATIALMSKLSTRDKLTSVQSGLVMISTFKELGGYSPDLTDRTAHFRREQNADYILGQKNAAKVITYVMGLDPLHNDPDIKLATEMAESTMMLGGTTKDAIGGALIQMLFSNVVKTRLGK